MNGRVRAGVGLSVTETGTLEMIVSSGTWNDLYSVNLLKLGSDEFNLSNGRFHRFCRAPQDYEVIVPHSNLDPVHGWASAVIAWIVENNNGPPWSMRCIAHNVASFELAFSFADAVEATHFALRWR